MSPDKGEHKHFNVKDSRSGQIDRLQHRVQFIDPEFDFRRTDLQVRQTLKQQRRMHRQDATHQEAAEQRRTPACRLSTAMARPTVCTDCTCA